MNNRKKLRLLKYSMSQVRLPFQVYYYNENFSTFKERKLKDVTEVLEGGYKKYGRVFTKQSEHFMNVFKLSEELGINDDDLKTMWLKTIEEHDKQRKLYTIKPQKEGRDNKGVYVGSGGGNKNMIRYPSKKRSKRTWKTFYTMFPHLAERDGWDGNSSKKMK